MEQSRDFMTKNEVDHTQSMLMGLKWLKIWVINVS